MCCASEGLVARYLFEEQHGDRIGDSNETKAPLDLYIPTAIQTQKKILSGFFPYIVFQKFKAGFVWGCHSEYYHFYSHRVSLACRTPTSL